jgi:thioredoxin 1
MTDDKKKKLLKILVPICIAIVLVLIWTLKTNSNQQDTNLVSSTLIENNEDFILEVSEIDLDKLKEYKKPIIIDFGADSCVPCKEMAPVLKSVNEQMRGKAIIKFVDVWKNGEAANGFPIQVIPTQVIINKDGSPYVPSENMEINFAMYSTRDTNEHVFTVHQGGLTQEQMTSILRDMGVN